MTTRTRVRTLAAALLFVSAAPRGALAEPRPPSGLETGAAGTANTPNSDDSTPPSGTDRANEGVSETTAQQADEAFELGVAAYRRGDYSAARAAFTRAYELEPSYRTAAVLGQTEEKLGHLPQAATLLKWALFHMDAAVESDARTRIDADLKLLQGRVMTLKLKTPVPFQEVLIDDLLFTRNSLRLLPAGNDTWTIYLEPNKYAITVRASGYHPQQRQVSGESGQRLDWELRWEPNTTSNAEAAQQSTDVAPRPGDTSALSAPNSPIRWQLPAAIVTGGLALVATGFGAYSWYGYNAASEDFDHAAAVLRNANLDAPCDATAPASTRSACLAVAAADQDAVTTGNRAIAAFSVAGALAVGSAALWVWWWNADPATSSATASWSFAPNLDGNSWGGVVGYRY